MKGRDAEDIVDALYKTSYIDGHISARLLSYNRYSTVLQPGPVFSEPELVASLPGGVPAVELLWELFTRTFKYGLAFLAYTIISGGYWSARFQVDVVFRSVASAPWFKKLFSDVESGSLAAYFVPQGKPKKWDFTSPIKKSSGFIYWFSLQIALTVSCWETYT